MPSKKSKGKRKEEESSSSAHTEEEDQSSSELSKPSSEEKGNSENMSTYSKRMSKLEQRLEALSRKGLQQVGVVRPYPAEWDPIPNPPKFKAPILPAFDGKGSPNQHIYYFKSQTGNVTNVVLARLFISTLKGIAFE